MRPSLIAALSLLLLGAADTKIDSRFKGLVGYWPLVSGYTQSTTVASDRSVYSNHGTATGTPPAFSAADGVDLNGTADYILIPDADQYSFTDGVSDKPMSICAWVYMDVVNNYYIAVRREIINNIPKQDWYFGGAGDKVYFVVYDDNMNAFTGKYLNASPQAETWIFYCATYDGSGFNTGVTMYKDGVAEAQTLASNGVYSNMGLKNVELWIGRQNSTYSNGKTQEVMIWNVEKTADEILEYYRKGRLGSDIVIDTAQADMVIDIP